MRQFWTWYEYGGRPLVYPVDGIRAEPFDIWLPPDDGRRYYMSEREAELEAWHMIRMRGRLYGSC